MNCMASSSWLFEWWDTSDLETLRKRAALEHTPNSVERNCYIVEIENIYTKNWRKLHKLEFNKYVLHQILLGRSVIMR